MSDSAWKHLEAVIGSCRRSDPTPPPAPEHVTLRDGRLPEAARQALRDLLGPEHVRTDRLTRLEHAGGKSYPDMRRLRDGDARRAPDVVVMPADADQIRRIFDLAAEHGFSVVPFGGGTSVVGGLDGDAGSHPVVTVDLCRLDKALRVDPVSRVAVLQPGMRGPDVEAALRPYGLTLGHYPQSHQEATIGGYVATRSAGQASTGYGRIDELVLGATLATPAGELVASAHSPASAAGPRLLDLVVGSEGVFGIITEATLRVAPMPAAKRYAAWALPGFSTASTALRELMQTLGHGVVPDVTRLSDEEETRIALMLAGPSGTALSTYLKGRRMTDPCLVIAVWEGDDDSVLKMRQSRTERVLRSHGGLRLPAKVAKSWEHGRFSGPYMRDELMGHQVLAETLETATTWDNIENLHERISSTLHETFDAMGTPAIVQCHISHLYAAGASLYFTFVARETDDPLAQWRTVKTAACEAIVATGGTITHHHAVGRDHQPYLESEIGALGVTVLDAVKGVLDPKGVLNPGVLVAERAEGS